MIRSRSSSLSRRCRRKLERRRRRHATADLARLHGAVALYLLTRAQAVPFPIETPYGPIPIPVAIPTHAPTELHIPRLGDNYTWEDVGNFVTGTAGAAWDFISGAADMTKDIVGGMIDDALDAAMTAWSSMINLAVDLTTTTFAQLSDISDAIIGHMLDTFAFVQDQIDFLASLESLLADVLLPGLEGELRNLERWIDGAIDNVQDVIRTWAIDNIYNPLLDEITGVREDVTAWVGAAIDSVYDQLSERITRENAATLAKLGALAITVAGLAEWMRDCGEDMCAHMGPKTDWSKLLKRLEKDGILAMLLAITLSDPKAIERAAVGLAETLGDTLESTVTGWLEPLTGPI